MLYHDLAQGTQHGHLFSPCSAHLSSRSSSLQISRCHVVFLPAPRIERIRVKVKLPLQAVIVRQDDKDITGRIEFLDLANRLQCHSVVASDDRRHREEGFMSALRKARKVAGQGQILRRPEDTSVTARVCPHEHRRFWRRSDPRKCTHWPTE